jgi:hypothetical protein
MFPQRLSHTDPEASKQFLVRMDQNAAVRVTIQRVKSEHESSSIQG